MDVECVSFKRRAAHYFPIPIRACFSLSLCGFPRGLDGRKMKFSREKKLGVVET